ncbi:MAG: hypothetical protein ACK5MO_10185 [Planctomyces sp.]
MGITRRSAVVLGVTGLAGMLVGCGGGAALPETIPVTGTVMYKGKPVEGAEVQFWGTGAPRAASGITDAEGKFSLSMFDINDGCLAGEHVVTISQGDGAKAASGPTPEQMLQDPMALAKAAATQAASKDSGPKSAIPEKYADRKLTPLKENISASNNKIVFNLAD